MGLGVAQHKAASLGEHSGIDIAHSAGLEVEGLGTEGLVHILLQVFGVDNHAVGCHATLVKDLAKQHIEGAKLRPELGEVDAPLGDGVTGGDHTLVVELVDGANELRAANENLALAASIARESTAHHVDNRLLVHALSIIEELLAGLLPDAASEHHVLLLSTVPNLAFHAKEERLLHSAKTENIVDCYYKYIDLQSIK